MKTSLKLAPDTANDDGGPSRKHNMIGQTLAVLRFLAATSKDLGVNAIAREIGIAPSSCFKILKHLCEEGFARFDLESKSYSLGSAAVQLARRALDPANVFGFLRPQLLAFAIMQGASVGFWRRVDRDRIVLAGFIESVDPMRIHMSVGQRLPMYIGAVGRAFAAELGLDRPDIERELAKLRWQSPPSIEAYCQQMAEYRVCGYSIDEDNFSPGVTTVATVLADSSGEPSFGISAIRLSGQTPDGGAQSVGRGLVELKQELLRNWPTRT